MRRWLAVAVLALGGCGPAADEAPTNGVAAGGVTLVSVNETLPAEAETLPAGPGQDVVTANCTACHSAAMLTAQPPLKPEQWAATVKKMREVYHAPIADADVPAILAYLDGLSTRAANPSPAGAATPAATAP